MQYLRRIPFYGLVALLVYMPLHIFLSQSLSLMTGGLEVWKVAKDVLLALLAVFTICLVFREKQGSRAFLTLLGLCALYGLVHVIAWAMHPEVYGRSAAVGFLLNLRLPACLLLGYGAYLLTPSKFAFSSLIRIVIGVSTLVVILGLLQYVLPKDILTHFGYSLDRGVRPAFFIDDNPAFPRIMSTLREPNALAAYLLLSIGLLVSATLRIRDRLRRMASAALLVLHILALYLTHSRSGLLALLVVIALIVWWQYRQVFLGLAKRFWPVLAVGLVLLFAGAYALRNDPHVQGLISHSTPDAETDDLDSNDYHWLFFKRGVEGIIDQPLGHGPGTAGLASIQNPAGSFLTENYYVQVGYELGVLGLAVFMVLHLWIYLRLRTQKHPLALTLLASFWGYIIINMLLHIWSNEAVAAQWWLLAGVVLAAAMTAEPAGPVSSRPERTSGSDAKTPAGQ